MIHKKIALLIIVLMIFSFGIVPVSSVPAAPGIHTLKQKDGSTFEAELWGDEWLHGYETAENYSIIFDETTEDWTYAITDEKGDLIKSNKVVGKHPPPDNIPKHLRPAKKERPKVHNLKESKASGAPGEAAPPGETVQPREAAPATTTANIPVILINFSDRTTNYTPANFNTLLFGTGVKSMKDYYEEVSYGKFSISPGPGGVVGWYTASNTHNYYGQNDAGGYDMYPGTLVREAVAAADATFDFAPYDANGDCYVDVVSIIHQGSGEEVVGNPLTDIWSHSWDLDNAKEWGDGAGNYTTNDIAACGNIKVNDYIIQPETLTGIQRSTIGVFAHEYGHALGLPDLYNTITGSAGIGKWSLMAGGSWNIISKQGDTPAQLDAWSKSFKGWVSPLKVNRSNFTSINQVENNSEVYQLLDNPNGAQDWTRFGTGIGEYFLVENRRKVYFDAALPGEGLLIWHINETRGNNDNDARRLVDLEEADGNDIPTQSTDPWKSNVTGFTNTSNPNSRLYNGSPSGVKIRNISASSSIMTADLIVNASGQNTYVQSSNGSLGLILKGRSRTINNSIILNNMGDSSAIVEARFSDNFSGVYGLLNGTNVLNATNFSLVLSSGVLVPLNITGADVQVVIAQPGVTALDARLDVPAGQSAGDYNGTVILTFSNNV